MALLLIPILCRRQLIFVESCDQPILWSFPLERHWVYEVLRGPCYLGGRSGRCPEVPIVEFPAFKKYLVSCACTVTGCRYVYSISPDRIPLRVNKIPSGVFFYFNFLFRLFMKVWAQILCLISLQYSKNPFTLTRFV